ncbi:hypothetical protein [Mycobacterium paragordonae]|uniref:Uncharacterized protein n=1 Tax=Mycobacterium paragordonae TaxID=1389713 RepID=A0AAJ1S9B1_9MYCO|nr:hypothetical protein [Mycobacterium paragordonae]MDP7739150.1 hypothetical protein [Mycobacterium paragordonae]
MTIGDTPWPDPHQTRANWPTAYGMNLDGFAAAATSWCWRPSWRRTTLVCMDSRTRQQHVMQLRDLADVFRHVVETPIK